MRGQPHLSRIGKCLVGGTPEKRLLTAIAIREGGTPKSKRSFSQKYSYLVLRVLEIPTSDITAGLDKVNPAISEDAVS
jgi:hypothetical protein